VKPARVKVSTTEEIWGKVEKENGEKEITADKIITQAE